ncbi:MAG: argininosuccinate lyase [Candidatus Obscuribacterales bacterium]|nr:argininosuccinate lyase [Candidatus Obscuribacterales bacterium]
MKVLRKAFKQELDKAVGKFVNSVQDDSKLVDFDIKGSAAHVQMLALVGLIDHADAALIAEGLSCLAEAYSEGRLQLKAEWEDVHMNVEKQLEAKVGPAAARLHTARSRNDQVALDTRLFTAAKISQLQTAILNLQEKLLNSALANQEVYMPGYTHLQRAQPILFAHAMHAFLEMLERDFERFTDCLKRVKCSPLGAAALAGSSLPVDPLLSANLAGFRAVFQNSLDAVSDRDFAVEFLSAVAITATHLSQLAETLVLWSSTEFSFVKFGDNVCTASSLMPNKKNPDPVELVRGKTGSIVGDLVNILVTLKALPLGYNRDLQECKPPIIHASETLFDALEVMSVVIDSMEVQAQNMALAAADPFLASTDLAEYLVKKGIPFRQAHEAVSELLSMAREQSKGPDELSLSELKLFAPEFEADVFELFAPSNSIAQKVSPGGTGYKSVAQALEFSRRRLNEKGLS